MKKRIFIFGTICLLSIFFLYILINYNSKIVIKKNNNILVSISDKQLIDKINNKDSFLLYTYNNFCTFSKPCDIVFKNILKKYELESFQITFAEFKNTSFYDEIKFGPSFVIVKNGKIKDYLDANSDKDYSRYQDEDDFEAWLKGYIEL